MIVEGLVPARVCGCDLSAALMLPLDRVAVGVCDGFQATHPGTAAKAKLPAAARRVGTPARVNETAGAEM